MGLLSGKPGVLWRGEGTARRLPASFQAVLRPAGYWLFMSTEIPSSFKYTNKQTNKNKSKTAWNLAGAGRGNFNVSFVSIQMTSQTRLRGVSLQALLQSSHAPMSHCRSFQSIKGLTVLCSLRSLHILSLWRCPFVLVKFYNRRLDEQTCCRLPCASGRTCAASLISLMFADCVWDLRNYSDFHPFQNGHSFLQPIQTKIRTEEKTPNPN